MAGIRGLPPAAWSPDSKKVAMVVLEGKRAGLAVYVFVTSIPFAILINSRGFRACRRFRVKTVAYRLTPALDAHLTGKAPKLTRLKAFGAEKR